VPAGRDLRHAQRQRRHVVPLQRLERLRQRTAGSRQHPAIHAGKPDDEHGQEDVVDQVE
jgi:hypothetical protein